MKSEIHEKVFTFCPTCEKPTDGMLIEDEKDIILRINCLEHGIIETRYFSNKNFYKQIIPAINSKNEKRKGIIDYSNFQDKVLEMQDPELSTITIHINLTERCNLKCNTCFANHENLNPDTTIDEVKEWIRPYIHLKKKPMVVIIGGEPTLNSDLPQIIRWLSENKFNTRLSTNGIMLQDLEYFRSLKEAGLKWVLLQFDGLKPETSKTIRGQDLIAVRKKVIDNANELGIFIHLIMMVVKGVNDDEIQDVYEFGRRNPAVFALNFYPASDMGKNELVRTYSYDVVEYLNKIGIYKEDIIYSKKVLSRFYRLFKRPIFKQNLCTFPLLLINKKDKQYPITNFFRPLFLLKNFGDFIWILTKLSVILNYEKKPIKGLFYLNIEKFFDADGVVMDDIYDCHNCVLTSKGIIPFCVYNLFYRTCF